MSWSERRKELLRSLAAAPTSPSAYALLLVLLATAVAKTMSAATTSGGQGYFLEALGACASDFAVYPAIALLVSAGERVRRWIRYMTYPMAAVAVVLALINAAYVAIANDQIDARVLDVGMNRLDEVADIAMLEAMERAGVMGLYALVGLPLGFVLIRWAWKRAQVSAEELSRLRVQGLMCIAVLGLLLLLVARVAGLPRTLAADLIADNAILHTYVTWTDEVYAPIEKYEGAREKHFALPMVAPDAMQRVAQDPSAPNVLIFVLESTRFDHVELPLQGHKSFVRTPNLRALAERGTFFTNVHAAMPHTSKSFVSILCGRLPAMENAVLEAADDVLRQCTPELFRSAGYATSFFQSAIGSFEFRPRFTVRLGYETFGAFETIDAKPIGYLAGDDRALPPAFGAWLTTLPPERRFFTTLLTSGTHHPYDVPDDIQGIDQTSSRARYGALVELEDRVLGETIEVLRKAGRLDNTIILTFADHGEGLMGDAVRQHDNNFFQESLHVPMIIAGPGVSISRVDDLMSLLDVSPTLLKVLGVDTILPSNELRFGTSTLHPKTPRQHAPFACWNDGMCEGFISDDAKVVRMIADHRELAFDRKHSLAETTFRRPTSSESEMLDRVSAENLITHLSLAPDLMATPIELPSGFVCGAGGRACAHPSRPKGGFHKRE